ncbi:MspA family porin [Nocardia sp. NPDC051570]|uniref:MspA family porin n=1 Tax=Nocardia sp. NPDC051570 TaxID=3364324 RepID=UPI0037BD976E
MWVKAVTITVAATVTGLASAVPASAQPVALAPHERVDTTPTGTQFTVGHKDETIEQVPALNQTPTSLEMFVGNTSYGHITGPGTGTLKTGYLLGCAVNLTAVSVGLLGQLGIAPGLTLGGGVAPSITIGPQLDAGPELTVTLAPGAIADVQGDTRPLTPDTAEYLTHRNTHLMLNGCLGGAAIRSYTTITITTPETNDGDTIYGDPTHLN